MPAGKGDNMTSVEFDRGTIGRAVPLLPRVPGRRSVEVDARPSFVRRLVVWMTREAALRRSRRALLDLTPDQLRDVGLTRDQALREGRRSFYLD